MWRLADGEYYAGASSRGRVGSVSPDGKRFVVVLRKGELASNTNRYMMLLWEVDEVVPNEKPPRTILQMRSSSNRDAIDASSIRWLEDNETIVFQGEDQNEEQQVFALSTRTRALRRLTHSKTSVRAFSLRSSTFGLAYLAEHASESMWDPDARAGGLLATDQFLPDLMTGRKGYRFRGRHDEMELFMQDSDGAHAMHLLGKPAPESSLALSPNGRYIVTATYIPVQDIRDEWAHYHDELLHVMLAFQRAGGHGHSAESVIQRYELVDTKSGGSRVLLDTPNPMSKPVIWAPDSLSVVVSDTFLPVKDTGSRESAQSGEGPEAVEVDITSGRVVRIGKRCHQAVRWPQSTDVLTCTARLAVVNDPGLGGEPSSGGQESTRSSAKPGLAGEDQTLVHYVKSNGTWHELNAYPDGQPRLNVILKEDMNTPPKIYVTRDGGREEVMIWDLNPQFSEMQFGRVEEITWESSKGQHDSAGLYYPPNYRPGRRYPLVIQTHQWNPNRFAIDGPWSTAYAAQPLAALGIFVLQVADEYIPKDFGVCGQLDEVNTAISIYRSAISLLQERGLIDAHRVGVVGFSHTSFYVKYALAHEPSMFAAASVAEGEDGGYLQYMAGLNSYVDANSLYGGPPFGRSFAEWERRAPSFNLNQVTTPLWINTLNPRFLLLDWEWFEGLRLLSKPVELVILQDGDHLLQKPLERQVSLQGNVDWFDFWLNRHEDPSVGKAAKYARWRTLREMRYADLARRDAQ
jgi:hypothetical protein